MIIVFVGWLSRLRPFATATRQWQSHVASASDRQYTKQGWLNRGVTAKDSDNNGDHSHQLTVKQGAKNHSSLKKTSNAPLKPRRSPPLFLSRNTPTLTHTHTRHKNVPQRVTPNDSCGFYIKVLGFEVCRVIVLGRLSRTRLWLLLVRTMYRTFPKNYWKGALKDRCKDGSKCKDGLNWASLVWIAQTKVEPFLTIESFGQGYIGLSTCRWMILASHRSPPCRSTTRAWHLPRNVSLVKRGSNPCKWHNETRPYEARI